MAGRRSAMIAPGVLCLLLTCAAGAAAAAPWQLPPCLTEARAALRDGKPEQAVLLLDGWLTSSATGQFHPVARDLARFLLARAELARGNGPAATQALREKLPALSAIGDEVLFQRGEALLLGGAAGPARAAFHELVTHQGHSARAARARFRIADCDLQLGRAARARQEYQQALAIYPEAPGGARIRWHIATALRQEGRKAEAALALRDLVLDRADPQVAADAQRTLGELAAQGIVPPPLTPQETLRWAGTLRYWKRWSEAEALLEPLVAHPTVTRDPDLRDEVLFQRGLNDWQRSRFQEAWDQLAPLGRKPKYRDRLRMPLVVLLVRLGRVDEALKERDAARPGFLRERELFLVDLGRYQEAAATLERQVKAQPALKRTEAVRWRSGWYAFRLGENSRARELLQELTRSPNKAMARKASYWLARVLVRIGEQQQARARFLELTQRNPPDYYSILASNRLRELDATPGNPGVPVTAGAPSPEERKPGEPVAPRPEKPCWKPPQYLPASPAAAGPEAAAHAPVTSAVPPTGARLTWGPPLDRFEPPRPVLPEPDALLQALHEQYGRVFPMAERARLFLLVGEEQLAIRELRIIAEERAEVLRGGSGREARRRAANGVASVDLRKEPRGSWGRRIDDSLDLPGCGGAARVRTIRNPGPDLDRLLGQAFAALGETYYAARFQSLPKGFRQSPLLGPQRATWARRYPRAFAPIVEREAAAFGVEPMLLWALMTMESLYCPDAISPADARGLMQVIPMTGNLIARHMGLVGYSPALLLEPEVSIRFSAWYLKQLLIKYQGQEVPAIASYNAGPQHVAPPLLHKPGLTTDEFVEELRWDEARNYVQGVLTFLLIYRTIYEGVDHLVLPNQLERDVESNINF